MRDIQGDLFAIDADAICITTNGFVKKNGEAVMGRGCAKRASQMIDGLDRHLGDLILKGGNRVHYLGDQNGTALVSFPVKPESVTVTRPEDVVSHWRERSSIGSVQPGFAATASLEIIRRSALELRQLAVEQRWERVVLPRPGCGAGELDWNLVRPVLEDVLNDRFFAITFPEKAGPDVGDGEY